MESIIIKINFKIQLKKTYPKSNLKIKMVDYKIPIN